MDPCRCWPSRSRVRRCCRQHPLPSELHGAHFDACSSSIEQRPCEIRPGTAPLAHDTPYGTRSPHWPWGQPGRYCDRAGYRDRWGPHQRGSLRSRRQYLLCPRAGWLSVHVRQHPREVSSLSRGVMSPTPIRPITGRPSLPPSSFTRRPVGSPYGRPTLREDDGLTTLHRRNPRGLGPALTPVALHLRRMSLQHPDLPLYRFVVQAYQHLWLVFVYDAYSGSPGLAIPAAPGPRPPWCWQSRFRLALQITTLKGEDTLSRGLRTPPLPATHASVGDCWQNSKCRHLLWKSNTFPTIPSCRTQTDKKQR